MNKLCLGGGRLSKYCCRTYSERQVVILSSSVPRKPEDHVSFNCTFIALCQLVFPKIFVVSSNKSWTLHVGVNQDIFHYHQKFPDSTTSTRGVIIPTEITIVFSLPKSKVHRVTISQLPSLSDIANVDLNMLQYEDIQRSAHTLKESIETPPEELWNLTLTKPDYWALKTLRVIDSGSIIMLKYA